MIFMSKTCFVMLGNKCNQSCSYCYQDKTASEFVFDEKIIATVDSCNRVMFYGGEPLLYFDIIEYIVKKMSNKQLINITTNGTLLSSSIVDFLNKHNIHVSLSHDGIKHQELRGYTDPLQTHGDFFLALKKKALICVVNNINYNYYNLWDYLRDNKLELAHTFQHAKWCGATDETFMFKDNREWEDLLEQVSCIAIDDLRRRRVSNELLFFKQYFNGGRDFCSCHDNYTCIDLAGNIYACHNYKLQRVGNRFCQPKCSAKPICGGGCLCEPNAYDCYLYKTLYRYCEKIMMEV